MLSDSDNNVGFTKSPVGARRTKTDIHLPDCAITRQRNGGSFRSKTLERLNIRD